MHPAAGRVISIVAISVCSVPVNQTLNENRSRIKAWLPWVDWYSSLAAVRAIIMLPRHICPTPRRRCGHSTTVIMAESVIILLVVSVLILPIPTSLTPRGDLGLWAD